MTTLLISNYAGNAAWDYLLHQSGLYLALHEANPTALGDPATEFAGGGYIRQLITFGAISGKACASNNSQIFPGLVPGTITWLAVWLGLSGGEMIVAQPLGTPLDTTESGQFLSEVGDFAVQL